MSALSESLARDSGTLKRLVGIYQQRSSLERYDNEMYYVRSHEAEINRLQNVINRLQQEREERLAEAKKWAQKVNDEAQVIMTSVSS